MIDKSREMLSQAIRSGRVEELYRAMCLDKKAYTSSMQATSQLNAVSRYDKRNGNEKKLSVYHCPFCGLLHVGHYRPSHNKTE